MRVVSVVGVERPGAAKLIRKEKLCNAGQAVLIMFHYKFNLEEQRRRRRKSNIQGSL